MKTKIFNFIWKKNSSKSQEKNKSNEDKSDEKKVNDPVTLPDTKCDFIYKDITSVPSCLDKNINTSNMPFSCYKLSMPEIFVLLVVKSEDYEKKFFRDFIKIKDDLSYAWSDKLSFLTANMNKCLVFVEKKDSYTIFKKNLNIDFQKEKMSSDYFKFPKKKEALTFNVYDQSCCILNSAEYKNLVFFNHRDKNVLRSQNNNEERIVLYFGYPIKGVVNKYDPELMFLNKTIGDMAREAASGVNGLILAYGMEYAIVGFNDTISAILFSLRLYESLEIFRCEALEFRFGIVKGKYYYEKTANPNNFHFYGQALNKAARVSKVKSKNCILFDKHIMNDLKDYDFDDMLVYLFGYEIVVDCSTELRGIKGEHVIYTICKKEKIL